MISSRLVVFLAGLFALVGPALSEPCEPRDFMALPLPADPAAPSWVTAILVAYPHLRPGPDGSSLVTSDGVTIEAEGPTGRAAREVLATPTLGDQFATPYPLTRDLGSRLTPFHDPGRARNQAFLAALYGADAETVRADLTTVAAGPGGTARFSVTRRHGVACQLQGAMASLAADWADLGPFFASVGGGFNWRRIAGTDRLSAHSYGIAVDINAELGGYWRWTGAAEGRVGPWDNKVPWRLVEEMERHGFIWGGKWHHFDGMHFEYRPELVLHSRLQAQARTD